MPDNRVPHATLLQREKVGDGPPERDIVIDQDTIFHLGDDGELHIIGRWKEAFWPLFFSEHDEPVEYCEFKLGQLRKARGGLNVEMYPDEYLREKTRDSPPPPVYIPVPGGPFGHIPLPRDTSPNASDKILGPIAPYNPKNDPRSLVDLLQDPAKYPWRSIGLMRIGDAFYAWRQGAETQLLLLDRSDRQPRIQPVRHLFGLLPDDEEPAVSGDLGWAFFSTSRGIVSKVDGMLTLTMLDGQTKKGSIPNHLALSRASSSRKETGPLSCWCKKEKANAW